MLVNIEALRGLNIRLTLLWCLIELAICQYFVNLNVWFTFTEAWYDFFLMK